MCGRWTSEARRLGTKAGCVAKAEAEAAALREIKAFNQAFIVNGMLVFVDLLCLCGFRFCVLDGVVLKFVQNVSKIAKTT